MDKSAIPTGERWLPVPGFSLYQASNHGRIWSSYGQGRFLKACMFGPPGYKYPGVVLCNGPIRWQARIHQIVMLTFVGSCPEGQEIRHLDGDKMNNRWEPGDTEEETKVAGGNLFYGTHKENGADMSRHGSAAAGARRGVEHYRARLTADLVRQIRDEYASGGMTERDLASRHDVHCTTIHALLIRRTWQHVA